MRRRAARDNAHGQRLLTNQRQALDARLNQYTGEGSVRTAAPGTTFYVAEHPDHLTPCPGQEVVVAFQNGNIDRHIVVGTVYNGQGGSDAQGNRIGSGTLQASASAFFAGDTHGASLSGLKTQQLNSMRNG